MEPLCASLCKFTGNGATVEFFDCLLGEILATGDIDGLEPALACASATLLMA